MGKSLKMLAKQEQLLAADDIPSTTSMDSGKSVKCYMAKSTRRDC